MASITPPPLSLLTGGTLNRLGEEAPSETLHSEDLWKDQPALILVLRRPGCGESFRVKKILVHNSCEYVMLQMLHIHPTMQHLAYMLFFELNNRATVLCSALQSGSKVTLGPEA